MAEFSETRSRNVVIKRMIHLGIIADRSEILPTRRRKLKKTVAAGSDDDDGRSESEDGNSASDSETPAQNIKVTIQNVKRKKGSSGGSKAAAPKRVVNAIALDVAKVQSLIAELDGDDKDNLEWIQESLHDAAEDVEESSEDPDDGVPLVPFTAKQRDSFENQTFKDLLNALGFQEPVKEMVCLEYFFWSTRIIVTIKPLNNFFCFIPQETYWRIPVNMTAAEMEKRAQILAGEYGESIEPTISVLDEDEDFDRLVVTDSEDDDDGSGLALASDTRREAYNTLIYNDSDNEELVAAPILVKQTDKKGKQKPKAKINIFDMIKNSTDADIEEDKENDEKNDFEIDSEDIRGRLAELNDSDNSDAEDNVMIKKASNTRKRITIVDSDTDSEAGESSAIRDCNKDQGAGKSQEFSSENIRSRLAELADSISDDDINMLPANKSNSNISGKRPTIVDSGGSDDEASFTNDDAHQSGRKRDRSDTEQSSDDQMVVTKKKRPSNVAQRNIIDDSDDDN